MNRYAYVEGNPVSYVDPFGLSKVDTSYAHSIFSDIGLLACLSGIVVSGGAGVIIFGIGVIASGINAGLYIYDAQEAETDEECYGAIEDFGWSLLSIGSGGSAQKIGVHIRSKWKGIIDLAVNIYGYFKA